MKYKSLIGGILILSSAAMAAPAAGSSYLDWTRQGHASVVQGQMNTFEVRIVNPGEAANFLLDLELYDSANRQVAQNFWDDLLIPKAGTGTYQDIYQITTPSGLAPGSYYWSAGVFRPHWGELLEWSHAPQSFTVTMGTTTPTSTPTTTPPVLPIGYYPTASPSRWYIMPDQWLGFEGRGFAPNETVRIESGETKLTAAADASGRFAAPNSVKVPFGWQDTSRTFEVKGDVSGKAIPLGITVGTFYPQINPASYWLMHGQIFAVQGSGYAPNEQVQLKINGSVVATTTADGSGGASFNLTAPSSGSEAALLGIGLSSGKSSSRTIYLHP